MTHSYTEKYDDKLLDATGLSDTHKTLQRSALSALSAFHSLSLSAQRCYFKSVLTEHMRE
jgi:hypothetical protein